MNDPYPPLRERREPTLIQKRPGRWTVRYRHAGKTRDVTVPITGDATRHGNPPKAVTDHVRKEHTIPYLAGRWSPFEPDRPADDGPSLTTFEEARAAFLARHARSPETKRTYDSVLGLLSARLEPQALVEEVAPADVTAFLDRDGVTPATRAHGHRHLAAFFKWAVREGIAEADVMDRVDKPRRQRRQRAFVMPGDLSKVLDRIGEKEPAVLADALRFALATGLRRAELVAAQASDVDLAAGTVSVRIKTAERDGLRFTPKGRADRRVRLTPLARRIAAAAIEATSTPADRLFRVKGRPLNPTRLTHAVADWRAPEAPGLTPHGLRGHYITYLLLLGWPVPLVQYLAGHADASTTMGYWRSAQSVVVGDGLRRFRTEALALGFEEYGGL